MVIALSLLAFLDAWSLIVLQTNTSRHSYHSLFSISVPVLVLVLRLLLYSTLVVGLH